MLLLGPNTPYSNTPDVIALTSRMTYHARDLPADDAISQLSKVDTSVTADQLVFQQLIKWSGQIYDLWFSLSSLAFIIITHQSISHRETSKLQDTIIPISYCDHTATAMTYAM